MKPPKPHPDEAARLAALGATNLLDSPSNDGFDDLVRVAAKVCDTPIALFTLVDGDRQWFLARHGVPEITQTSRDVSFCGHAILGNDLFQIPDATLDPRFADNPLVTGDPGIRFYAAQPILDAETRLPLGTLCVIDRQPRSLRSDQCDVLSQLAHLAQTLIHDHRQIDFLSTQILDSEHRYSHLYRDTPAMLHSIDNSGRMLNVSEQWLEVMGYNRDEVIGRLLTDFLTDTSRQRAQEQGIQDFVLKGRIDDAPYQMVTKAGRIIDVLLSATAERDRDGNVVRSLAAVRDVTAMLRAESALSQASKRMAVTLRAIADAVISTDSGGRIDYLNPVAEWMTGWRSNQALGRHVDEVFHIVNETTHESEPSVVGRCLVDGQIHHVAQGKLLLSRNGAEYFIAVSASPIRDDEGDQVGAVLVFHDRTEERRAQLDLVRQSQEDPLTGLANRREFELRIERALDTARERHVRHALLYLDLDRFKAINDTHGHPVGDELLRQVAALFLNNLRQRDTVARLGGDEFGVLLENCPQHTAMDLAEKLRLAVAEHHFEHNGQRLDMKLSIGVATIDEVCANAADAVRAADSALYAAKDRGRNQVHLTSTGD